MHLKALKVFCDVVRHRSFSEAAAENAISQPGASQMVSQLEEHLGVRLLDRSKRPLTVTAEGDVFYEGCRKLVQRYEALEEEVRTFHDEVAGRVTVASIYSVGLSHMNRFVQEFMQRHPRANVRIQYQHPDRVYELVESDQVDLGLVSYPKASRGIRAIRWRDEPMVLVCAPGHPLVAHPEVALSDLNGWSLITFDPELQIRRELDRLLAEHEVEMRVAMEFDNIETIKRAVEIDAGVAILPQPTIDKEVQSGSLVARRLADATLSRPVGIVVRAGKELGRTTRRFIELLQAQEPDRPPAGDDAVEGARQQLPQLNGRGHGKRGRPLKRAAR